MKPFKTTVLGTISDDAWCVYADGFMRAAAILIDNTNTLITEKLYYRKRGELLYQVVDMTNTGGDNFTAQIPGNYVTEGGINYNIYAKDDVGVGNTHGTIDKPNEVVLDDSNPPAIPQNFVAADNLTGGEALLTWDAITDTAGDFGKSGRK